MSANVHKFSLNWYYFAIIIINCFLHQIQCACTTNSPPSKDWNWAQLDCGNFLCTKPVPSSEWPIGYSNCNFYITSSQYCYFQCWCNGCSTTDATSNWVQSNCPKSYSCSYGFCDSTCDQCYYPIYRPGCSSCRSSYLTYSTSPTFSSYGYCNVASTSNAQVLLTISRSLYIYSNAYLKSITYNTNTVINNTDSSKGYLNNYTLYTNYSVSANLFTSNSIVYSFNAFIHKKLIIRLKANTQCINGENTTFSMAIGTDLRTQQISPSFVFQTLVQNVFNHVDTSFDLTISFGTYTQTCIKTYSEITIYYEKCLAKCLSNDCPNTEPYYKHPVLNKCVSTCPVGYYLLGVDCIAYSYCNSTCDTCLVPLVDSQCTSCSSAFLQYSTSPTPSSPGFCTVVPNGKYTYFYTISKTTVMKINYMYMVTYNGTSNTTANITLDSFMYNGNIVEISATLSNYIMYEMYPLPWVHRYFLIRTKVYTTCVSPNNRTVNIAIGSTTSVTLLPNVETVIQSRHAHTGSDMYLYIYFGTYTENCKKMIQDVSIYYQRCQDYCGIDCPDSFPYYTHPTILKCVNNCPAGYNELGTGCTPFSLCNSTCYNCSVKLDSSQCNQCSSSYVSFNSSPTATTPGACTIASTFRSQLLFVISKDTVLGSSYVQTVTYNGTAVQNTSGKPLSAFLYSQNVIQFTSFSSASIVISLGNLPTHTYLLARTRVYTQCNSSNAQNSTFSFKIETTDLQNTCSKNTQTLIQTSQIVHTSSSLTLTLSFGNVSQGCYRMVQDIAIYYRKCESYCLTSVCPNAPYYKHPTQSICVDDCPVGYTESGTSCTPFSFCHSTCSTCTTKQSASTCTACSSIYMQYTAYNRVASPYNCYITSGYKTQAYYSIIEKTASLNSYVKSVTYNGSIVQQTAGKLMSSFLYVQNVIQFTTFSSSSMTFTIINLPSKHRYIIVRIRAYTECSAANGNNITFGVKLGYNQTSMQLGPPSTELIVQHQVYDFQTSYNLTIEFGNNLEPCKKMIQEVSLYFQACQDYCISNSCPSTMPYYKSPTANGCTNLCPYGYLQQGQGCVLYSFCNSTCSSCDVNLDASRCTACVSNFLSYIDPNINSNNPSSCSVAADFKYTYLMTISKDSAIGSNYISNLYYNSTSFTTVGTKLSQLCYSGNVIQFISLNSTYLQIYFTGLPIHRKLLFRAIAFTTCSNTQNNTFNMMTNYGSHLLVNISSNVSTPVQAQISVPAASLYFYLYFGTYTENCKKMIQDFAVYYQRCQDYCGIDCPDSFPYYAHPTILKCVSNCPPGYNELSTGCTQFAFCSSECNICSSKLDPSKCTGCQSSYLSYSTAPTSTIPGLCSVSPTFRYQKLITINKDAMIDPTSYIKSVIYNSTIVESSNNKLLSQFLYTQNVIQFTAFSSSSIIITLNNLLPHVYIYARARVYTQCNNASNQNNTFVLRVGTTDASLMISPIKTQMLVQNTFYHSDPSINITLMFGNISQTCLKMVQDITVFYQKCQNVCGSNDCPDVKPYFKDPFSSFCRYWCPAGYIGVGSYCQTASYCHSTCNTCALKQNSSQCTSCSSTFLQFQYLPTASSPGTCGGGSGALAQLLVTIDKNTSLSSSYFQSVQYGYWLIQNTATGTLGSSGLYTSNVIQFFYIYYKLTRFTLKNLPPHVYVRLRLRVYAQCSASRGENISFNITLGTNTTSVLVSPQRAQFIVQHSAYDSEPTISFSFIFGSQQEQDCLRNLQDISVYYQKCENFCEGNTCPNTKPYYKHPTSASCVSVCPTGYLISGNYCVAYQFCNSTCGTCTVPMDGSMCSSCSSSYISQYSTTPTISNPGYCSVSSNYKMQLLYVINKASSISVTSLLYGVCCYSNTTQTTQSGYSLSSVYYQVNVIPFVPVLATGLLFHLYPLPPNIYVMVRFRVFTTCTDQNRDLQLTINKDPNLVLRYYNIPTNQSVLIQYTALTNFSSGSLLYVGIQFGITNQTTCQKMTQDISIYYQKCQDYCITNDCPTSRPYYKHPKLDKCITDCPIGYLNQVTDCGVYKLCKSTCDSCTQKEDQSKCENCSSTYLTYSNTISSSDPGFCSVASNFKYQLLDIIDRDTFLGSVSYVKSVTFNSSIVEQTVNKLLSSFLYAEEVIEYTAFSSNAITFFIVNLPLHTHLLVRVKAFTQCSSSFSTNVSVKLDATQTNASATMKVEKVVQATAVHTANNVTIIITFGIASQATCKKMIQDFSLYYQKCEDYCESNICPNVQPYYKHWIFPKCVDQCSAGYTNQSTSCIPLKLCNSACNTCVNTQNQTSCSSCLSTFLQYLNPPINATSPGSCSLASTYRSQLLYVIDKTTILGTSIVKSVTYGSSIIQSTEGITLSSFLFIQNIFDITMLQGDSVTFQLSDLPIHKYIMVRLKAYTSCGVDKSQNITLTLKIDEAAIYKNITQKRTEVLVQNQVQHSSNNLQLFLSFGDNNQDCKKQVQDISVYFRKCQDYCLTNDCPNIQPYYKHNNLSKCVNDCPNGFTQSGNGCVPFKFCNSTCDSCSQALDSSKCTACSSNFLLYSNPPDISQNPAQCSLQSTFKYQPLYTISRSTILGSTFLKNITFNSTVIEKTVGKSLLGVLYIENVIEFTNFSSPTIQFCLANLPIHRFILVRVRAYTQCFTENKTLTIKLGNNNISQEIDQQFTQFIVENQVYHSDTTINLTISFGDVSQSCKKMIQDIGLYFKRCEDYCITNDCPAALPYYTHPFETRCVSDCPTGYNEYQTECIKFQFCDSTCNTCASKLNENQCTNCSSLIMNYSLPDPERQLPSEQFPGNCTPQLLYNLKQLFKIDKSTTLVQTYLKNVTYNGTIVQDVGGVILENLLYKQNVIDFTEFSSNEISFYLDQLPIHIKMAVRVRVMTQCSIMLDNTMSVNIAGESAGSLVQKVLDTPGKQYVAENALNHTDTSLLIRIQFGQAAQPCRKMLQQITVYYSKCQSYCLSGECPDQQPYYKHPFMNKCVQNCPIGYAEGNHICIPLQYCNSTCNQCKNNLNSSSCTSCSSEILKFEPSTATQFQCQPILTQNWRLFASFDRSSRIKQSYLKRVIYNGNVTYNGQNIMIGSFLYTINVIQFTSFSDSSIFMEFENIPFSYTMLIRFRVFTQCQSSQNNTFYVKYDIKQKSAKIPYMKESIVQTASFMQTTTPLPLIMSFGSIKQKCRKLVQDFSFYYLICPYYCAKCQNNATVKQLNSSICLSDCPKGQFVFYNASIRQIQCSQCINSCLECNITSDNCTKCGIVYGISYFYISNTSSNLSKGSCVLQCGQTFYEDSNYFQCFSCDYGCVLCDQNPINCTKCRSYGQTNFFLQPSSNRCLPTCPVGYYEEVKKFKCTLCDSRCSSCSGPLNDTCFGCKKDKYNVTHYLVPGETICSNVCPDRYYGQQKVNKCLACDKNCKTCSHKPKFCTSCHSIDESTYIYFFNNECHENCGVLFYLYQGQCLQRCPQGTQQKIIIGYKYCRKCKGSHCVPPTFQIQSRMLDNGKQIQNKLTFSNRVEQNMTVQRIKQTLTLYILHKQQPTDSPKITADNQQLKIVSIKISVKRDYILVNAQNLGQKFNLSNIYIMARFPTNYTRDQVGTPYDPAFSQNKLDGFDYILKYYQGNKTFSLLLLGMGGCVLSFIMLLFGLIKVQIKASKAYHEILSFILLIQCIGFTRVKLNDFPNIQIYQILQGFSFYQLRFLPNFVPSIIRDNSYKSFNEMPISFAYGSNDFFQVVGRQMQTIVPIQLILLILMYLTRNSETKFQKIKTIQEAIVTLIMSKIMMTSCIVLYSLKLHDSSQATQDYWVSIQWGASMLLFYSIYFAAWVFRNFKYQFYKLHNIFRVVAIFFTSLDHQYPAIALNIVQIAALVIDLIFFRHLKLNLPIYIIEKLLIIAIFNSALFLSSTIWLYLSLGICFLTILSFKTYQIYRWNKVLKLSIDFDFTAQQFNQIYPSSKIKVVAQQSVTNEVLRTRSERITSFDKSYAFMLPDREL